MRALIIAAVVLVGHIAAGIGLIRPAMRQADRPRSVRSEDTLLLVSLLEDRESWDTVPVPEVQLSSPPIELVTLRAIRFDDPDDGISDVVGPASAPRPHARQSFDTSVFAKQAGLSRGASAAVILEVEILADGKLGIVSVFQSAGDSRVDAAAIEYTRSLRWIPATKDHQPVSARIRFPVLLTPTA